MAALAVPAIVQAAPGASAAVPLVVQPTQTLVTLFDSQTAMSAPSGSARAVQFVDARRPITGEQTVLPVIGVRLSMR